MADGIRQLSDPSLPWPSDEKILADLEGGGSEAALAILLGRMRLLGQDHGPDDWPAVQMRDITALCDAAMRRHTNAELNRLRALLAQAEEALSQAERGRDSLRYLLNWAEDAPRTRLGTILETFDSDGTTSRERLEALWRALDPKIIAAIRGAK